MADAGRARAADFTWDAAATRLWAALRDVGTAPAGVGSAIS